MITAYKEDANVSITPKEGDYYFDTLNKIIYTYQTTGWKKVVELEDKTQERIVIVTFNLNTLDDSAYFDPEDDSEYYIKKGYSFAEDGYDIPVPNRPGYKFAGWYTEKKPNLLINGAFTDLTTVNKNITLYAQWVLE